MKALLFVVALIAFGAVHSAEAAVCPFCDAPTLVMAEQLQLCRHLLLGKYLSGTKPTDIAGGSTRFEVIDVAFSKDARFTRGQVLEFPMYFSGTPDRTYTLMGPEDRLEDWHPPGDITETGWLYLSKMPLPVTDKAAQAERLLYFLPYFEHPDQMVSNDAFAEFAAAPYDVIKPLREKLPREKIFGWLADPKVSVTRTGFYGLMAGLCGRPEDASILEKKILILDSDFRLGIEGVMAGYLLLRGEDGLKVLEDAKMRSKTAQDKNGKEVMLPFSETYAVMQTLRFMWTYEPERIPRERLMASMRILLDRPELADLVITDLSRWKDWSIQDRLFDSYDDEKFAIPAVRRATIRYLMACSEDKGPKNPDGSENIPEHAARAAEKLRILEQKDPRTFSDARRFFRP